MKLLFINWAIEDIYFLEVMSREKIKKQNYMQTKMLPD